MINFNGKLTSIVDILSVNNRGLNYGDGVFETIKRTKTKCLFLEDHYFRLMASMRLMRMEIPMEFTLEFFQLEITKLLEGINFINSPTRIKIFVFRNEGGLYTPLDNTISFIISAKKIEFENYLLSNNEYLVDLFKDHYISPSLLSTLKTNNKAVHVLAGVYGKENDFDNCLLLNTNKHVIEANNGNLFIVKGKTIKTPPISDGCLNGILRKQLLRILNKDANYTIVEESISPFELQKADELFFTNVIIGIQPITKYRKKTYTSKVSYYLLEKVNSMISN